VPEGAQGEAAPAALDIAVCIATVAILSCGMMIRDVLPLLTGAGGIGVALLPVTCGQRVERIGRVVRAYIRAEGCGGRHGMPRGARGPHCAGTRGLPARSTQL
jgi:hypothetical protein